MTDLFVEQPEEQLYSTLNPDEKPDPVGELGTAISDIASAGVDIAGEIFTPGWWEWPPWKDTVESVGTTLRDLMGQTGEFAPPEDEELTGEDLSARVAQDTLPAVSKDKGEEGGDAILKALHFEMMTGEAAFAKWINWLGNSGVHMVSRRGAPLGESAIYEETESGARQPNLAFQGQTGGSTTASIVNLRTAAGQKELLTYLRSDWRNIPDLLELVTQNLSTNWSAFMDATVDGNRPGTFGITEEDPDVFAQMMRQFGRFGDDTAMLATVDDIYGINSAQDIIGGTLDAAITAYAAEISGTQTMMRGPSLEEDEGGVSTGDVGFILSFDGTPYGDIVSVNDLFSGGKLGELNAYPYMESLYDNTRDASGYSATIEQIQQGLFAWGVLRPDENFEWGKLDIPGMNSMADLTVDAIQILQADIANEALKVWRHNPADLAPDASPYMAAVEQRLIARNVTTGDLRRNQDRKFERDVIEQVSQNIQNRINASGSGYQPMRQQGIKEVEAVIEQMLNELGSQEREEYFGRGGSANQRKLVNSLMADFYDDPDWGSQIFFGAQNGDKDFLNYAKNAGALTEDQMKLMQRGLMSPDNFRENWDPNDVGALQAAEQDVVTSNLLKYIADNMTNDEMSADAVRRGMITFAHTIGQRTAHERGYSDNDYRQMVSKAMDSVIDAPAVSPLVSTLEGRVADSFNLVGGGGGGDFHSLMDALGRRQGHVNTLRVRNV